MGALGISARAHASPAARAFIGAEDGAITTYARLDDRAARLAGALAVRGVASGDRVAIASLARPEVFEAQLACSRLGAALVPLNWRLANAELDAVIALARPAVLIADAQLDHLTWENSALPIVPLGAAYEAALKDATPLPARRPAPDEIAQILFTSGTTGHAKGAMLSWRQVEFNATQTIAMCELTDRSGTLAFLPTFHTGGLNCLAIPTLAAGGCVHLMRRFDAERAAALLASGAIEATVAVPVMYRALLDAGFVGTPRAAHNFLVGGAPLPGDLATAFAAIGCSLRQGFGMTEVGPNCFTGGGADIGFPTPGTTARIVDADGTPLPAGSTGELELAGPHVCAGYFENEEASAAARRGSWFRTGDLAVRDAGGRFAIRGRQKEMFISGGENVYPAEVEAVLAAHPAIAEVAVIGVADSRWGEVGLAVVVATAVALTPAELESFARAHLASYKVPRHFRFVDALPKTSTEKVSKSELVSIFAGTFAHTIASGAQPTAASPISSL